MSMNVGRMLRQGPSEASRAPEVPLQVVADSPQPLPEWREDGPLVSSWVKDWGCWPRHLEFVRGRLARWPS